MKEGPRRRGEWQRMQKKWAHSSMSWGPGQLSLMNGPVGLSKVWPHRNERKAWPDLEKDLECLRPKGEGDGQRG